MKYRMKNENAVTTCSNNFGRLIWLLLLLLLFFTLPTEILRH